MRKTKVFATSKISCAACQYLRYGRWPYMVCENVGVENARGEQVRFHKDGMELYEFTCKQFVKRNGPVIDAQERIAEREFRKKNPW